ncbi:MAG: GNAT family N-acetyltransferase [Candidatus Aquicultorales bacterium]
MIRKAQPYDLPSVASIYKRAFPDSIEHIFGKEPSDQPFIDIYRFLLDEFPDYFLVEEEEGKVVGYVVAPPDVSALVKDAVLKGYVLRWSWRWMRGRYGFGLTPVGVLLADKWAFLRSKDKASESSDARILSIAVDPDRQGKGLGKKLTKVGMELLDRAGADKIMLEVREQNERAKHIYKKLGFHEVGSFRDKGGVWVQMIAHIRRRKKAA